MTRMEQTIAQILKLDCPCGGMGKCGKCKIKISGQLSRPTDFEKRILGELINDGWRLACQTYPQGAFEVERQYSTAEKKRFESAFGELAVDIGTTTLEVRLINDNCVVERSLPNPQRRFGADVISRIGAASTHSDELTNELRETLKRLTEGLEYDRAVICANTVMLHFLMGLDVSKMAAYPFEVESLFGEWTDGESIGLSKKVYLPRCVSTFVGADTVCAIIASKPKFDESTLIVDLGTNGEIAFCRDGKTICTSTAAGPALEGADISCGMRAENGAVDSVKYREDTEDGVFEIHVVGDCKPCGICGSGLISAVAAMLDAGVIDCTGYIEKNFELASGLFITPKDIRAFQLAKSAIRTGIDMLLEKCGCDSVDRLCIAGNFGRGLDISACIKVGLFPKCQKIDILGNAALLGAHMILGGEKDNFDIEYVDLASKEDFNEKFTENLLL